MPMPDNNVIKLAADKRALIGKPTRRAEKHARTLAITSGKGGVGKSNVATNLAVTLAQKGARVCIFDADTNLANANILMGLTPQYSIHDVLSGLKTIDEVMVKGPGNVTIVPAASGIAEADDFDDAQKNRLLQALETLEKRFDYLLIDTAAGINENVIRFLRSAESILLVISTEPTSLTDAFALLRVLKRSGYKRVTHVLVNMAINFGNGMEVFKRFDGAVKKYLKLPLNFIGYITDDIAVRDSIRQQCPVVLFRPDSLASRCFSNIERVLLSHLSNNDNGKNFSFSSFWNKTLSSVNDGIRQRDASKTLTKPMSGNGGISEKLSNDISSAALTRKDSLELVVKLLESMPQSTMMNSVDMENASLWKKIEGLISGKSEQVQQLCRSDLTDMSERLISSGNRLEADIDRLIDEIETLLDRPLDS